ncbi:hypothetical protein BGZ60DRAFT_507289 [Tricladium varicosporioides]|nr:hypothetical protein BGZ60DRAFT_507289 [Hymenoscyphus varicosporioides]
MANTQGIAERPRSLAPEDYSVGWICALPIELTAAIAMIDTHHGSLKSQPKDDGNNYTLGSIGGHNVVMACLPRYGTNDAAIAGISMQRTFPNLRFGVMVGIGGGIPSLENDIRLGDIAVSLPSGQAGGVIQHDMGKKEEGGFQRTGSLNSPPTLLLTAIAKLRATRTLGREITGVVNRAFSEEDDKEWRFPEKEKDILLEDGDEFINDSLQGKKIVQREERKSRDPKCFYGNISSGNSVIKNTKERSRLAMEGVICVEMEAAGLMNFFNCTVIRGICDYADEHKHKRWQPYAAAVAAAYAKRLLCIISPQPLKIHPKAHWCVPFGQNNQFVGREKQLQEVIAKLAPEEYEKDCQRVAITGLGGIGKTQVALEAAFRIRERHPDCSVFWVSAVNVPSFEAAFLEIGLKFQIPGINEDEANVKSLVQAYLSQETAGRWLLIVDNADDFSMLYQSTKESEKNVGSPALANYLPFSCNGSILFTTRNHKAAVNQAGTNVVTIEDMTESESLELLKTSLVKKGKVIVEGDAKKLVRLLTYLPLAIKQAAAFINQEEIYISQYLEVYDSSDQELIELLSIDFEDQGRYKTIKNPIASTWWISFYHIQKDNQLAAEYLFIMSCVAQRDIPRSLLPSSSKLNELRAIGTLKAYAFITELKEGNSYDIHRLVQIAVRTWLREKGELHRWSGETLKQVSEIFPFFQQENKNECTKYLPHVQCILNFQEFPEAFQGSLHSLLFKTGEYFRQTGKYTEAENRYRQVLELTKRALGDDHPDTLDSMNSLAEVFRRQGKYIEAERLQWQTLELRKQVLGDDHPNTLDSMSNLAVVFRGQGKYIDAERLQRQTLELRRQVLGDDHPNTLDSISNLAEVFRRQGKYIEAERLQRQTLELRRQVLGDDHPNTLDSMSNLAEVFRRQGKYIEAERLQRQTLELRRQVLGDDHPDTLDSMSNLATVLENQGKYIDAEALQRQTLKLKKQVLGDNHPSTLDSLNNLAVVLVEQGKYTEAEALQRQTLELKKQVLGDDHPSTLDSMNNLAIVLVEQGKYTEAEALQRQTLELKKQVLGDDHPYTLDSMNNLAIVLEEQGKYTEAEALQRQTLELRKQVLGDNHPSTLDSMNNLAIVLEDQRKYTEAEALQRQTLELRKQVLGDDHPDTLGSMNNLAILLGDQGKYTEAEALQRQTLELRKQVLGDDHPDTINCMNNLAILLKDQGKYTEAETLELSSRAFSSTTLHKITNLQPQYNSQQNLNWPREYPTSRTLTRKTLSQELKSTTGTSPRSSYISFIRSRHSNLVISLQGHDTFLLL